MLTLLTFLSSLAALVVSVYVLFENVRLERELNAMERRLDQLLSEAKVEPKKLMRRQRSEQ